jgi:hypothetical protein
MVYRILKHPLIPIFRKSQLPDQLQFETFKTTECQLPFDLENREQKEMSYYVLLVVWF